MQNVAAYQGLLDTHEPKDEFTLAQRKDFMHHAISDAEKSRVPWKVVDKKGDVGDDIESLDEGFLHDIMTGEKPSSVWSLSKKTAPGVPVQISQLKSLANPDFIVKTESAMTLEDFCNIMNVPVSAMLVSASALKPEFDCKKDLAVNFKNVVTSLLTNRKEREKQRPTRTLFGMDMKALEQ